ncbi:MAG: hypothetical protein A2Z83_08820 [Omnitrophica bacterium GWA2_52_8]|nr:MAG: hypothetical protein A2Z83_08820 [Omnitrophica bacterium GWA2_52_8]
MRKKILLADDLVDMLDSEQDLLEECGLGYEVHTASTAEDTLEILEKNNFDLVILDVMIPQKGGLATLREIRHRFNVPVIIYSAYLEKVTPRVLLKEGAAAVLSKPAPVDLFLNTVKSVLEPESTTTLVISDGYHLKEVNNQDLTRHLRELLRKGQLGADLASGNLRMSEEFLQFLLKKFNLAL